MARMTPLWQQGSSYPATLDRLLLSTLWPSGGARGAPPAAVANTMNVNIPAGTVVVPLQAGQGSALCVWDAAEVVTLAAAPPAGQSRIDVVIAQVRDTALDAGPNNDFVFQVVQGAPAAANPAVPAIPNNAVPMCNVTVPGAAANLNGATVADQRSSLLLGPRGTPAGAIHQTVAQGIGNAQTVLTNMALDFVYGGMTFSAAQNGLVVPTPGLYSCTGVVAWGSASVTNHQTSIARNGAAMLGTTTAFPYPGNNMEVEVLTTALVACNAGDVLAVTGFSSAGIINTSGAAFGRSRLHVVQVSG